MLLSMLWNDAKMSPRGDQMSPEHCKDHTTEQEENKSAQQYNTTKTWSDSSTELPYIMAILADLIKTKITRQTDYWNPCD